MLAYLTWNVGPIIGKLGPLTFRYYSLLFSVMSLIGVGLVLWQTKKIGLNEDQRIQFAFYLLVAMIIGARLGQVLFYAPGFYFRHPLEIFKIWKGGLASHGATAALLIAVWLYARKIGRKFLELADRMTMSVAVAIIFVRIGNFFNHEIVGRVTDVPWAVEFLKSKAGTEPRHPSQLYESMLGMVVLAILLYLDAKVADRYGRGLLAGTLVIVYFGGRFFLEFFKEYQTLSPNFPLTMGQILSIPMIAVGIWWLRIAWKGRVKE